MNEMAASIWQIAEVILNTASLMWQWFMQIRKKEGKKEEADINGTLDQKCYY